MKARILLVDDEKSIRMTFEHFLSDEGYEVMTSRDYEEALSIISENPFDLIISDIVMGAKSGIDLLKEINHRNVDCPVVMITGAPDITTATDALRLGAYDYLTKPVKKQVLLHMAEMALKHKVLNDEKEKYRLHLETIFSSMNEGIVTLDKEGMLTEVNGAAERICGYSRDDVGKNVEALPLHCNGTCHDVLSETMANKKNVEVYRHECKDKKHPGKVVTIKTSPLFDQGGNISGTMLLITDETQLDQLERDLYERKHFHNIIGKGEKIQQIYALIEDLADVSTTVLITGESGTGKELVADALHYKGILKDSPLVKVNCSALQENLLESELFGHVKGAFTGAIDDKEGRFQKADSGTIFLDEVGDISHRIQLQLLRVLQEKEFERVGDSEPIKVDIRIIAATNQDLREKVKRGEFREDLYYRLKVVEISMPPLRDNKDDIPLLVDHFMKKFRKKFNRDIKGISSEVMSVFMDYDWPGNIRELEHTMERAFVLCHQNTIVVDHLPRELRKVRLNEETSQTAKESDTIKSILQALEKYGGNISKASRFLGISRPTLYRKIKEIKKKRNETNKL